MTAPEPKEGTPADAYDPDDEDGLPPPCPRCGAASGICPNCGLSAEHGKLPVDPADFSDSVAAEFGDG